MAISYLGAGAQASGSSTTTGGARTLTVGMPPGSAGDLMILVAQAGRAPSQAGTTPTITTPTGWNVLKVQYMSTSAPAIFQGIWWRQRVGGDAAPSLTFPFPNVYYSAQILAYTSTATTKEWATCSNTTSSNLGPSTTPFTPSAPSLTRLGCVFSFVTTGAAGQTPSLTGTGASANGFTRNATATLTTFNYSQWAVGTRDLVAVGTAPVPSWSTSVTSSFGTLLATTVAFTSEPVAPPPPEGGFYLGPLRIG